MKLKEHTLLPEMQFLCACCRVNPTAADMATQTALAPVVDMGRLVVMARRHRVEPMLLYHLKRIEGIVWDEPSRDSLEKRVKRSTEKSLMSIKSNIELAHSMREQGIGFLPFKGVTLAQRYYGNISLRHANDIDFWVPEEGIEPMRKLLSARGGKVAPGAGYQEIERGRLHTRFLRRQYCEEAWDMPNGDHLEIHWRLTTNPHALRLNPNEVLKSGKKVLFGKHELTVMAEVPLLLYLCEHGARHGWYRLKWLFDLPQVLEGNRWDWEEVLSAAKRANCLSSLLLGLKLAEVLFGWNAPELVSRTMQGCRLLDWQVGFVLRK
ncbi:MAG: nucleotidyltransferase family protein, partial [Gallionella sp.]|nr:nucleotidyltransferase family protein [Gallionella sp.]